MLLVSAAIRGRRLTKPGGTRCLFPGSMCRRKKSQPNYTRSLQRTPSQLLLRRPKRHNISLKDSVRGLARKSFAEPIRKVPFELVEAGGFPEGEVLFERLPGVRSGSHGGRGTLSVF